jgi:hypothetical protein
MVEGRACRRGAYGSAYDPEYAFEFGLQRILDGVEALVRSR